MLWFVSLCVRDTVTICFPGYSRQGYNPNSLIMPNDHVNKFPWRLDDKVLMEPHISLLQYAIVTNNTSAVDTLLKAGVDVNATTDDLSYTPLELAARVNDDGNSPENPFGLVRLLSSYGGAIDPSRGNLESYLLSAAMETGNVSAVKYLLHDGIQVVPQWFTAAALYHRQEILELFASFSAQFSHPNVDHPELQHMIQPALEAILESRNRDSKSLDVLSWLIKNGADISSVEMDENFIVQFVLEIMEEEDSEDTTPKMAHPILEDVLARGANPDCPRTRQTYRCSPLQMASYIGHKQAVQLLLKYGADIEFIPPPQSRRHSYSNKWRFSSLREIRNSAPLLVSLKSSFAVGDDDRIEVAILLLSHNLPAKLMGGELKAAIFLGSEDLVRKLLERGARDQFQGTEVEEAIQGNNVAVARLLMEFGATSKVSIAVPSLEMAKFCWQHHLIPHEASCYSSLTLYNMTLALLDIRNYCSLKRMICWRPPGSPDDFEIAVFAMALFNKDEKLLSLLWEPQFHSGPWVTNKFGPHPVRIVNGIYYLEVSSCSYREDIHLLEIAIFIENRYREIHLFDGILGSGISLDGLRLSRFIRGGASTQKVVDLLKAGASLHGDELNCIESAINRNSMDLLKILLERSAKVNLSYQNRLE